jgi:nucleoside-diphosphate-sugar epimerase
MRVLVAGDRGYIGAVLVPFLRAAGHQADGSDLGLDGECDLDRGPEDDGVRWSRDIRLPTGEVRLESDGSPWRPLAHVEDISRAFLAALEAPRELVHDGARQPDGPALAQRPTT